MSCFDLLYVGMLPPHPGGSGISWGQLLRGLAARGHRIRAVAPITAQSLAAGDVFARAHPELELHRFLVPHYYTGPNVPAADDYLELERSCLEELLPRLFAAKRPDLVIIGRESFGLHVPALAVEHRIPCIQGIRGNTTIAILNGSYPPEHGVRLLREFGRVDLMVSVAEHMAAGLRRLGFANLSVIPNAIDLRLFGADRSDPELEARVGRKPGETLVLHVSNLKGVKRPLDLVGSAEIALAAEPSLRYVVAGDGAFRSAMEEECRRRKLMPRFQFLGWVEYSRIPALMQMADMIVSMSESEGLSRVYLEAQASARLLIASDIAPAREVVEDGVTGLLFRKGDVADLARTTVRAARNPELRMSIGRAAARRVEANSLDRAIHRYLATFASIVGDPGRKRDGEFGPGPSEYPPSWQEAGK